MSGVVALRVDDLHVVFKTPAGIVQAVNGVSFTLEAGRTLGIVGESGCGKSVTALSMLRLIEPPGTITRGKVRLNGHNLLDLGNEQLRRVRGAEMAMVFQDPMTSLNPVLTIGKQVSEVISSHLNLSRMETRDKTLALLTKVGLPNPGKIYNRLPFQLSGGQRQRVMIAMALALKPRVLIADEPTTALDVTVQAQILAELNRLKREFNTAIVLITHDLGIVAGMADEVAVMYAGSIVEQASAVDIFENPGHPYTCALLYSIPRLGGADKLKPVPGQPPDPLELPGHCAFAPRCPGAGKQCRQKKPRLEPISTGHMVACHHPVARQAQRAILI
ncbi:MAG: ABC transporter ATP-binding protein [Firmicutes bacterium]|nr:ABC transporter ATP-binding protein [Bacillota bacterium]